MNIFNKPRKKKQEQKMIIDSVVISNGSDKTNIILNKLRLSPMFPELEYFQTNRAQTFICCKYKQF